MELRRPEIRQLFLWQLTVVLGAAVPSLLTSLLFVPGSRPWRLATFLWAAAALGLILVGLPLYYLRLGYLLDGERLLLTSGVVYLHTQVLPLGAVQTVRISAGPLQRLAGLRTVGCMPPGPGSRCRGFRHREAARLAEQLLPEGGERA